MHSSHTQHVKPNSRFPNFMEVVVKVEVSAINFAAVVFELSSSGNFPSLRVRFASD